MGWIGDRCPYPHLLAYSHTRPQDGRKAKVERREGGPAGYTRKPVETYTHLWDTHRRSCILPFVFMISPPVVSPAESSMSDLSRFSVVFIRSIPDSPRMLVYTAFEGPMPPIIGYWVMN